MSDTALSMDTLDRAVAALGDDALTPSRRAALERFRQRGLPTTRDEDWKYTDLRDVAAVSQRALETAAAAPVDEARVRDITGSLDAAWFVIVNGRLSERLSTGIGDAGVVVDRMTEFGDPDSPASPLADLNIALLRQAVSLTITDAHRADRPVGLLIADFTGEEAALSPVRLALKLASGARAEIIEYHVSSGNAPHYSNAQLSIDLNEDSSADYLRFQNRATSHYQTARLRATLGERARFHHCGIDIGGCLTRNDLHVDITGRDASARFDGLYIAGSGQHIDNHTRVDHRVGPAVSDQHYRGILSGRCRAVWNGKAIVHAGADGTDAQQANHNLLLSDQAEIDAKPELEIYADEVKCAHGTTVGQLDDRALFYLRTRGIDRRRASRILTRAFAATVVERSPIEALHERIGERVEWRLRELDVEDDA